MHVINMVFKPSDLSKKVFLTYVTYLIFELFVQCKKPENKRLLAIWRLECEFNIVTDPDCPIDGGWSPWTPWSACHGACDNVGHRRRSRECNNPLPSKDGLPCNGFDQQIESCYPKNCSIEDYRIIVRGDTARTEALRQLEMIPAFMERCLQIECPFEAVEAALATENTWQLNSEALWNALLCVKHDLGCSVNGAWGAWGPWSACKAQCGKGSRWRVRRCDTPPPSVSHLVCFGAPLQNKECEGDQCAIDEQYSELSISGTWSEWAEWTKCSEKCGSGVRRRKRTCIEKPTLISSSIWTTHCHGPYEELEICKVKKCLLNGGWSGWGAWGPCSQTCGAGKRSRTRSCTRPIPSGGGVNCFGPKVDVGCCHLTPCESYSHTIAVFNGDSVLQYNFPRKFSRFFHFYIRFMPLSPHGTLIRKGTIQNPHVRISLHKWHLCLDACGSLNTCCLPRTCTPSALEPSVWHSTLIAITNEAATLRINDAQIPIQNSFPCDPELTPDILNIFVGEKLHGEIQELILNFIPLNINMERENTVSGTNFVPTSASNIAYENANMEEAYINIENDQYLRLPCFKAQNEWQLELTIKSKRENGIILFLTNYNSSSWFYIMLQSMRLVIKFTSGEFKSEATSSTECLPYQWLDIKVIKRKDTNTIEVLINSGEHLHILLTDYKFKNHRRLNKQCSNSSNLFQNNTEFTEINLNQERLPTYSFNTKLNFLCSYEYFIGGIPLPLRIKVSEDLAPFLGILASMKVNNVLLDLHNMDMERYKNGIIQFSSRTASISGSYHETSWGESNVLNLTCVHSRTTRSPFPAYWLYLDTVVENMNMCSVDDGRILRLTTSTTSNRPGFYTCRASDNERTRNYITYGIIGRSHYKFTGPDTLTVIAVCTTVILVIFTFAWLILEGYHDVRDGYGFFRDDQIPSEDQANTNDQNTHATDSENKFHSNSAKARRKRRRIHVKSLLETREELKMHQVEKTSDENTQNEPEMLPALPEFKSSIIKPPHEIYRCEPFYVNSPLFDSKILSLKTKLPSSSTNTSPGRLCSRLLLAEPKKEALIKTKDYNSILDSGNGPKLLTMKYSPFVNNSPAQIVLKKFQNIKYTDP